MIKKEAMLWVLSACSIAMGAVGAVTGINANAKADKINAEPTSSQWKAFRKLWGDDYFKKRDVRYLATIYEGEGEVGNTNIFYPNMEGITSGMECLEGQYIIAMDNIGVMEKTITLATVVIKGTDEIGWAIASVNRLGGE